MKPQTVSQLLLGTILMMMPSIAAAQATCDAALQGFASATSGSDPAAIMQSYSAVAASDCDPARVGGARAQASALMARAAQAALAAGDVDGAEQLVLQAPGVHWSVQAVRGDIAAKRGARSEAAMLYNNALDTLGDPGLTVQVPALEPVAERLASLAQENMMLAGSMESGVTRGGEARGVMAVAARGLSVEKVAPADAKVYEPEKPPAYVDPAKQEPAPAYQAPVASEEYNVIQAAAAKVESVFLPIRFGFDSDVLDATGTREALRLSEFMKFNKVGTLIITGHTDDVGNEAYNLDLSFRRAESLARFLLSDGVSSNISVVGLGETRPPLYSDASAYSIDELRTIARRVEVSFAY